MIAQEFMNFIEAYYQPLLSYEDVFTGNILPEAVSETVRSESHTRLYLAAKNILKSLEAKLSHSEQDADCLIPRLIDFLKIYPVDLRIGIMKDLKSGYPISYKIALENDAFVELYFEAYGIVR
jgi:hypothetical protein